MITDAHVLALALATTVSFGCGAATAVHLTARRFELEVGLPTISRLETAIRTMIAHMVESATQLTELSTAAKHDDAHDEAVAAAFVEGQRRGGESVIDDVDQHLAQHIASTRVLSISATETAYARERRLEREAVGRRLQMFRTWLQQTWGPDNATDEESIA